MLSCPKYIVLPQVNVERHDAGGVKVDITGPRLNPAIELWSVRVVVMANECCGVHSKNQTRF